MTDTNSALAQMLANGNLVLSAFPELSLEFDDIGRKVAHSPCPGCTAARLGNRLIMLAARAAAIRPRQLPAALVTMLGPAFPRELARAERQPGGRRDA